MTVRRLGPGSWYANDWYTTPNAITLATPRYERTYLDGWTTIDPSDSIAGSRRHIANPIPIPPRKPRGGPKFLRHHKP